MAQRKRSAGKPGRIKYGSAEWEQYRKSKDKEKRRRISQMDAPRTTAKQRKRRAAMSRKRRK